MKTASALCCLALVAGACSSASDAGAPGTGSPVASGARGDAGAGTTPGEDGEPAPAPPVPGLHVEYFDGYHDNLASAIEPTVDHVWKDGPPAATIGRDRFSARWTATLTPARAGKTKLIVDADDGMRLWLDDELVIDDWRAHFVERHTVDVDLDPAKPVQLRLEYFEADLDASVRLSWSADGLAEAIIPEDRFTTTNEGSGLPGPKPPITNPVLATSCPDPGVLATKDAFYMVCTGGKLPLRTSRDLVTWATVPNAFVLADGKPTWADNGGRNWAPEIHPGGDGFLAYYTSVNANDVLSIGVASAPKPTGPWTDKGAALVQNALGVIDATFFRDDDGSQWLFYKIDGNSDGKPTPILVRKLTADGLSFAAGSTAKQVLVNDLAWEGGVVEAPWVVKRDGRYYMFYSGNVYNHLYKTGVARATTLTGAWEKKGAPILVNNAKWVGPGHGSVVPVPSSDSKDAGSTDYFVYHAWENAGNGLAIEAKGREVLVDRIEWKSGWPTIGNGSPTSGAQPWPGEAR